MIIDCVVDFKLRQIVNQSRRLVKEKGCENSIWVVIEPDEESNLGYSVYFVDITTNDKIKVNPEKLANYYDRQNSQNLSDLLPA